MSLVRSHRWLKARPGVEHESPNRGYLSIKQAAQVTKNSDHKMYSWIVVKMLLISFKCYKCITGAHCLPAHFSQNK